MPPLDRPSLRQGLFDDLDALEALESDIVAAKIQQAQAQVHLEEAEAVVKRAQAVLRSAESECQLAASHVQHLVTRRSTLITSMAQARLLLRTVATFPEEVLSLVFHEACAPRPSRQNRRIEIDMDAIVMPYRIASVCRHWRSAALATPSMWTYIALPLGEVDKDLGKRFEKHLEIAINRSCVMPLDVVVLAGFAPQPVAPQATALKWAYGDLINYLFGILIGNTYRLRSLAIHSTDDGTGLLHPGTEFVRDAVINLLRCPTPLLEELDVYIPDLNSGTLPWLGYPEHAFPRMLPEAPLLWRIRLQDIPILCCHAPFSLPSLVSFDYTSSPHSAAYGELLWDMFKLSPKLEHVKLDIDPLDIERLASSMTTERNTLAIRSLHVRNPDSHLVLLGHPRFNMPNLTTLSIGARLLLDIDDEVLGSLGESLKTLKLFSPGLHPGTENALRQLKAIETLKIKGGGEIGFDFDDDHEADLIFDLLCSLEEPVMWPCLRAVSLRSRHPRGVENDGLLRLLCTRNLRDGVAEGETMPRPIEKVDFDTFSVPAWVAVNIKSMLGDKCTITDKKYYVL